MVGSSGGKKSVNSEKWPCGLCEKTLLSIQHVESGFTSGVVMYVVHRRW